MTIAQIVSLLALRRLTGAVRASAGMALGGNPSSRLLAEHPAATLGALSHASRRAWLALEVALRGSSLWDRILAACPDLQKSVLRQQMDVFLEALTLAGIGSAEGYADDLRNARQAQLLAFGPTEGENGEPIFLNTATGGDDTEWHALEEKAGELDKAGFAKLARLLGLRSLWKEPLILGIVEYFLSRSLRAADLDGDLDDEGADDWRCLEKLAGLLEKHESAITEILDHPGEATPAEDGNEQAVEQLYQLGLRRYKHGDYQQAAAHFTAALKLTPASFRLYAQRGEANRLLCEYERAIADFNLAIRLGGKNAAILVSRALAYHVSGEQHRAGADCSAALEIDPNHAAAYRTRAAARAELGDNDLALADLTEAIARAPEDAEAYYLRGVIQARKRDYVQAIADFNRTLEVNSYHVLAFLQRGHAYRCRGDHVQAIRDYGEVLRHHPSNVIALSGRGLAYKFKGEPDRAIADFTEALRFEPDNGQIFFHRGVLYRAKGELNRAQADLDEAIRRQPENWAALYHRAKISLAQGQFALALLDLTEVVHLNSKLAVGFLSRALVYDRLGQHEEGIQDTTQALKLNEASPAAHLIRGVIYAHAAEHAAAIGNLTQAIRLDESFALAYHERCMAYTMQKEYDRALADANRLIALEPRNARAYAHRSVIHHFMGEVQQALSDYSQALQIDPSSMLSGWNPGLAESARGQTTQRIADYIDGVRPETSAGEAPPTPEFQIVLKPAGAPVETTPEPDTSAQTTTPALAQRAPETAVMPALTDAPAEAAPVKPRPVSKKPRKSAPSTNGKASATTNTAPAPKTEESTSASTATPADEVSADRAAVKAAVADLAVEQTEDDDVSLDVSEEFKNAEELALKELLAEEPAQPAKEATKEPIEEGPVPKRVPESSRLKQAYAAAVAMSQSTPQEPAAFTKAPSLPSSPTVKPAAARPKLKKRDDDDDEPSLFQKWKKPVPMGVTAAVALVLLLLCLPLFKSSGRVQVFPAQGKAEYEGQPIPNATVFLHPTWLKEPNFPRPRGTVSEDGTYVLGTYRNDDGAPPGEYKVTVQWYKKAELGDDDRFLPSNLLPQRYAKADTSDLTVQIHEGDNQLPAIKLKDE